MNDLRRRLSHRIKDTLELIGFRRKLKKAPPVFVYQMGKVASSSVHLSLKWEYPGVVLHSHNFRKNHPRFKIRQLFEYRKQGNPIKIVTLVREPVSRNVSAYFENLERYFGALSREKIQALTNSQLMEKFLAEFQHDVTLEWFDTHLKRDFGIDVYDYPFDHQQGYVTIKKDNLEVLIMRHDLTDAEKEKFVKELTGLREFRLKTFNVGENKLYANLYKEFKRVSIPAGYLERMTNSKYCKHFYTPEAIRLEVGKWTNA